MRRLHEEPWSWTLDETPEGLVLTVVVGTVALHEVTQVLDGTHVRRWRAQGPRGLATLVQAIQRKG